MAKKLDQILVVDLESTCWAGDPPPGEEHQIIEIGLYVLDMAAGERLEKKSPIVCPTRRHASSISHTAAFSHHAQSSGTLE